MILDGLEGTEVIADDILVYGVGETEEEARLNHDDNLIKLLDRVRAKGVKINRDKMKLHLNEIKYMGHLLTTAGVKPDPEKVKSIREMQIPTNKTEIKRFLGTVNYLSKFIPHLSTLAELLRDAAKENEVFTFGEKEIQAWKALKAAISKTLCCGIMILRNLQ